MKRSYNQGERSGVMVVRVDNNYLTDKDIELLKLEEKKRELYNRIKNDTDLGQDEKQKLFKWYKQLRDEIKEIAYMSTGLFNDAEYGHLLRDRKLNLELLKEWRLNQMEEMTAEELIENMKGLLSEKEFSVFIKFFLEYKGYEEIIDEMDISKSYGYDLKSRAKKKIKDKYDLDKVIEMLGKIFTDDNDSETEEEPEEQFNNEINCKGVFVAFDDDLETDDVEQISQLITRIQGVSHISESNPKVEELKRKTSSLMDKF
jgi:predicted DNA-binding protein YlxM (UPF0122 family)